MAGFALLACKFVSPSDSNDWPDRIRGALLGLLGVIVSIAVLGLAMYVDSVT